MDSRSIQNNTNHNKSILVGSHSDSVDTKRKGSYGSDPESPANDRKKTILNHQQYLVEMMQNAAKDGRWKHELLQQETRFLYGIYKRVIDVDPDKGMKVYKAYLAKYNQYINAHTAHLEKREKILEQWKNYRVANDLNNYFDS